MSNLSRRRSIFLLWVLGIAISSLMTSWRISDTIVIPKDDEQHFIHPPSPLLQKLSPNQNRTVSINPQATSLHIESFNASAGKVQGTIEILSQEPRSFRTNAIVILAQKKHSTYQRDSYGYLIKALDLIHENYLSLNQHADNADVFIFHTGDFNETDLLLLEPHVGGDPGILKLVNLNNSPYWYLPQWHKKDDQTKWLQSDVYPLGYRHMCAWFGIRIWNFFRDMNAELGTHYQYILRIDEDSFIFSPINYDIFEYMNQSGFVYGFRLCAYELGYNRFIRPWFRQWHNKANPKREITDDLCGMYNNFFVADIEFFHSQPVQKYLKSLDRQGFIYRKRYGDLMIHTSAVYAFANSSQIHRFLDFTYQHLSTEHVIESQIGCVTWGGIQAGYNDPNADKTLAQFRRDRIDGRNCTTARTDTMLLPDLSPSYQHFPPSLKDKDEAFALKTIMVGDVELPNKGVLSG